MKVYVTDEYWPGYTTTAEIVLVDNFYALGGIKIEANKPGSPVLSEVAAFYCEYHLLTEVNKWVKRMAEQVQRHRPPWWMFWKR